MSKQKNVSRRQFVAGTVAAGVAAVTAKTARACPLVFDDDGNRVEYWCIVDIDDAHPVFWIYTFKNCTDGSTYTTIGSPGFSKGDCGDDPENDSGCITSIEIDSWQMEEALSNKSEALCVLACSEGF